MAREKRESPHSVSSQTGSSAAGSAADAGMGIAASSATAAYDSHLASTPEGLGSPMSDLPNELKQHIGSFLPNPAAAALSQTSSLFRANMANAANPASMANRRAAQELLLCVVNGDEEAVAAILQERPDLLTMRTLNFYDVHTDTQFVGVSAWEYALWAGDTRYMANRMLDCIPETPIGADIKSIVAQQYERHNLVGLDCIVKDGTHYVEKHFDFTPLLDAYASFSSAAGDAMRAHTSLTYARAWDACDALWLAVGREQRKLPVHVRQHYCDPVTRFEPLPAFQVEQLKRCLTFFDWETKAWDVWGPAVSSRLGVDFVIARGSGRPYCARLPPAPSWPGRDFEPEYLPEMLALSEADARACLRLFEVRTNRDYAALGARLASELNPTRGAAGPAGRP